VPKIILGITLVSSLVDTIANLGIIPPVVTYIGTALAILIMGSVLVWLKKSPLNWTTSDGFPVRIKSLNIGTWLIFVGIIIALWFPRVPEYYQPMKTVEIIRIGLVAGHWGNDSGAVCPNGMTEAEINLKIASLALQKLQALGYQVDFFEEFDQRIKNYSGAALISIHADSCDYINDSATGFKVSPVISKTTDKNTENLATCMINQYQKTTGMYEYRFGATNDMSFYHSFDEIKSTTPAIVLETGFLNLDYQTLVTRSDLIASGIVNGLICFVESSLDSKVAFAVLKQEGTYVVFIQNVTNAPLDLSHWKLKDEFENELLLDDSWHLYPNDERKIYIDNEKPGFPYWNLASDTLWKPKGQVFLIDTNNQIFVAIIQ
jgi:N-acetylmuramoyl-L-alanine amidase